jgi:hypothetical protein
MNTKNEMGSGSCAPVTLLCRFVQWLAHRHKRKAIRHIEAIENGMAMYNDATVHYLKRAKAYLKAAQIGNRHNADSSQPAPKI